MKFTSLRKSIKFDNVNFSYLNRGLTINNLSLEIKNKTTAIVGESIVKSTIIDILLGFNKPSVILNMTKLT